LAESDDLGDKVPSSRVQGQSPIKGTGSPKAEEKCLNYCTNFKVNVWHSPTESRLFRAEKQFKSNSISHCPALHSSGAARNLCTSYVALTSSRDQAAVTFVTLVLTLHCRCIFFSFVFLCSITIFVICHYHMWWMTIYNSYVATKLWA